ncbi:serine/threonine-protein kinase RsbW [Nocardioides luteus]|uniref:Anti-sigma regulatory factor n=1 Tax=Nocardioides luteus TaxID=1844 RepID=A0ABQ5SVN3_9ACTN|nr:anti-sigma factor [Nocardioides luteus]MDR7311791.1 serine/threonine-protein kinase RsbW [Nocardioides luteus]GGR71889.1 anti-sigma regulatory factor [Nocardioides luteus]GLJ68034.1 anti-sigma regulatory factor [Nocardioides luteus]
MPQVEMRLPAEGAYVSVLRTTTAALAARLDFTLEDIEDLRMAVSEAAALCLECAAENAELEVVFDLGEDTVGVTVTTTCDTEAVIDRASFAWQVLTTLARGVTATPDGDRLRISLVAGATPPGAAR